MVEFAADEVWARPFGVQLGSTTHQSCIHPKAIGRVSTATAATSMRFLRKKKGDGDSRQLYVRISASRAADLSPLDDGDAPEPPRINPVLVAVLNNTRRKTARRVHTASPSWDDALLVPLVPNELSQILVLTVWDKHRRYKTYLGELRLCLGDVFGVTEAAAAAAAGTATGAAAAAPRWHRLYLGSTQHGFVSGSVLVGFELVVKRRRGRRGAPAAAEVGAPGTPAVVVDPPDVFTRLDALQLDDLDVAVSEAERLELLRQWLRSLVVPFPDARLVQPDEQGFYPETVATAMADASDMESMAVELLVEAGAATPSRAVHLALDAASDESVALESSGALLLPAALTAAAPPPPPAVAARKRKARAPRFAVGNRQVHGVMFLEIISCLDLPPLRNITRTSFDMDPFVVVTFGKRTFRTSWKRHTLNPIFNERVAFEILSHETNYDIQLLVLDKDHFLFHDKVAQVTLKMKEIVEMARGAAPGVSAPPALTLALALTALLASETDGGRSVSPGSADAADAKIRFADDPNSVSSVRKRRFTKRRRITVHQADTSHFVTVELALDLHNPKYFGKFAPSLKLRARFEPYEQLRRQLWKVLLEQYQLNEVPGQYDYFELIALLDTLGCHDSDDIVGGFFEQHHKLAWGGDTLSHEEISESLERHVSGARADQQLFEVDQCPICCQKRLAKKHDADIITHVAICASKDWLLVSKLLLLLYATPQVATRRWFSKALIKLSYGKYKLGSNSANILVQDRRTGIIMEEKMGVYVRLGIRLLYRGLDLAKKRRIRQLLQSLSVRQGAKFDHAALRSDIGAFVKFHSLDLLECLEPDLGRYATFNEFFYRKLQRGARPLAAADDRVVVSPADSRCTAFDTVTAATELWIKGRNFSLAKLFNGDFGGLQGSALFEPLQCCIAVFRLAPQDYHRFHAPVSGTVTLIKHIAGEYYTVNPMAVRLELDVFGENVRTLVAIETADFGTVIMVAVGAMMVGLIVLTVGEGDRLARGDEVGYFKFGGSTILLLFAKARFAFDSDIVDNSAACIETLVRVGQSVGHSPQIAQCLVDHIDFDRQLQDFKLNLIRVLTGGDLSTARELSNWEATKLQFD